MEDCEIKVSRQKTQHLCVGIQEPVQEEKLLGQKPRTMQEFKCQ